MSLALLMLLSLSATPAAAKKKAATQAKVKVAVVKMYKTTKNKKVFIRLKKGAVVTVVSEHGKWVKVKARGHVGFVLKNKLVKVKSKAAGKDAAAFLFS